MENTDKKKPSMGKVFGVAFLVVIGIFLVMAMLETVFKDSSSNNNNLNSQDTSLKTTNQKNTPSEINKKSLSPTEEYLNAMIIDYDNVNKLSKAIEVDTNKMIDSELSKEQYCSSLDQAKEIISKSKTSFNNLTLPKDILLLNELEKLRNAIISKINLINSTFKNTDKYCTENSILSLTNARDSLGRINWDYDNRNRPLEADPFSGSATESWDQAVYRISNDIKAKLSSSPKADSAAKNTVYSIGDTIDKGGLKVTLKSVQKDFIHYDYSYLKDDREWTDAEWKEILNYQLKIGTENKESVRQQLIKELNDKYGSRVTIKWVFFDFAISHDGSKKAIQYQSQYYFGHDEPLITIYDVKANKLLPDTEKFDSSFMRYARGLFHPSLEKDLSQIKVILSFEKCGTTKSDIDAIERGEICPNTYVFDVDFSKI